ncbi:HAMP domain-containing histidine kinase [Paenibacillus sp. WQ 127069]|uniref:histidine kinase n=1 Tax=Paenibacillus baimaensis TaxID=2982185 RepID=A0ABT2UEQ6_9BACL|nr:HAMP domain-containing sensor histidine kinase [Paenibacillus sp. WQ 127069]MCU6793087.1 HAMP domain-containing histidine kinase [Paenibacillus sp. WQ 127069]
MSKFSTQRLSLLQYWTSRYVITLIIGLVCIGVFTFFWIEYSFNRHQIQAGHQFIDDVKRIVDNGEGRIELGPSELLPRYIEQQRTAVGLTGNLLLLIMDNQGKLVFAKPEMPPEMRTIAIQQASQFVPEESYRDIELRQNDKYFYLVRNLQNNGTMLGHVYLLLPYKEISKSKDELTLMVILLGSAAILGWIIIYLLARRLVSPVQDIVEATRQIISGKYDVRLKMEIKVREVYELQESFAEMAVRLGQLEYLRTKLLASVTHELKTPVTAISGLVQAVRDQVVTGDDAQHFMDVCFKESQRLDRMVEDLLEFNSFATGSIKVAMEHINMNRFLDEMVRQWAMMQEGPLVKIHAALPAQQLFALTDASRLQQVFINLFNNAKAALEGDRDQEGGITITLYAENGVIGIDVHDTGCGIEVHEQPLVFESFYRGEGKQRKVRGMGLGLPLCRLIMTTLGGAIVLKESSPSGTTFSLNLKSVSG